MKRKRILAVAAAALLAVIGVVGWRFGGADRQSKPGDGVNVHSTHEPGEVIDYWTPERKRDATGG